MSAQDTLLEVSELDVTYRSRGFRRPGFAALKSVSVDVAPGQTLGLVGESGSGKTTLGRAVLGLAPVTAGSIRYSGREIAHLSRRERRTLATEIQVVFQDPYNSLNPALTIEQILAEPLTARGWTARDARARVSALLDRVHLPADAARRLPREFSGGQRQRVAIARALALEPKLVVCDEPVSALDLTTQARVLELFREIQEATGVGYLFVSHDIDVIRYISHRVAVMYRGEIVEHGAVEEVTRNPSHPYTQQLVLAAPVPDPDRQRERREQRRAMLAVS